MHLWIFLIAMMHVAAAVALLVLPYLRMLEWRQWQVSWRLLQRACYPVE